MSDEEYDSLAEEVVEGNPGMVEGVRDAAAKVEAPHGGKKIQGKVMWFVGQMVRKGEEGRVQPERAEGAVRRALGL